MLSYMKPIGKKHFRYARFGGIDRSEVTGDGMFADMKNMTLDRFPAASSRPPRGEAVERVGEGETAVAAFYCGAPCLVTKKPFGEEFEYLLKRGGKSYTVGVTTAYTREERPDGKQNAVLFGHTLYLFPLGAYIDLDGLPAAPDPSFTYGGNLKTDNQWAGFPSFCLCDAAGTVLTNVVYASAPPVDTTAVFVDLSGLAPVCKSYDREEEDWLPVKDCFVRIAGSFEKNGEVLKAGEKVRLVNTGCGLDGYSTLVKAELEPDGQNGRYAGYIVVRGVIGGEYEKDGPIPTSMHRVFPEMDHVFECGNRLWGCRYGNDLEGKFVNEIYASALGTVDRFYLFEGVSTDSYIASRGTPGQFTGAVNCFGVPVFFREKMMHKIYGTVPESYQVSDLPCEGVRAGCEKSLVIVGQKLYYLSPAGVTVYDGGQPVRFARELGDLSEADYAAAGSENGKYCLSLKKGNGRAELFVYDPAVGMWAKEDDANALLFACGKEAYFFDGAALRALWSKSGGNVPWMMKTGIITFGTSSYKYLSSLSGRVCLPVGSRAEFYLRCDGEGRFEKIASLRGKGVRSFMLFLKPRRFTGAEFLILGEGAVRLDELSFALRPGGSASAPSAHGGTL